jgi:hypothetical protein
MTDGKDNDHDGKKDCQDPDCMRIAKCRRGGTHGGTEKGWMCFDGKDNDHDGKADCDDPDCQKDPRARRRCAHTETGRECFDGKDNDHDGKTDCQDPDCLKDRRVQQRCRQHGHGASGWRKEKNHYCASNQDFNKKYGSLAAAQKACKAVWNCEAVSDGNCDGKGQFVTCKSKTGTRSRSGSCMYLKPK